MHPSRPYITFLSNETISNVTKTLLDVIVCFYFANSNYSLICSRLISIPALASPHSLRKHFSAFSQVPFDNPKLSKSSENSGSCVSKQSWAKIRWRLQWRGRIVESVHLSSRTNYMMICWKIYRNIFTHFHIKTQRLKRRKNKNKKPRIWFKQKPLWWEHPHRRRANAPLQSHQSLWSCFGLPTPHPICQRSHVPSNVIDCVTL